MGTITQILLASLNRLSARISKRRGKPKYQIRAKYARSRNNICLNITESGFKFLTSLVHEEVEREKREIKPLRTDDEALAYMGTDAKRWAEVYRDVCLRNGFDCAGLDEGFVTSWFANAIESGRSAAVLVLNELPPPGTKFEAEQVPDVVRKAFQTFGRIISDVENRCIASDGPVTPTLDEMEEKELASLWRAVQIIKTFFEQQILGKNGFAGDEHHQAVMRSITDELTKNIARALHSELRAQERISHDISQYRIGARYVNLNDQTHKRITNELIRELKTANLPAPWQGPYFTLEDIYGVVNEFAAHLTCLPGTLMLGSPHESSVIVPILERWLKSVGVTAKCNTEWRASKGLTPIEDDHPDLPFPAQEVQVAQTHETGENPREHTRKVDWATYACPVGSTSRTFAPAGDSEYIDHNTICSGCGETYEKHLNERGLGVGVERQPAD